MRIYYSGVGGAWDTGPEKLVPGTDIMLSYHTVSIMKSQMRRLRELLENRKCDFTIQGMGKEQAIL